MSHVVSLPTLKALRRFIHEQMCARDALDPEQTPMFQAVITKSGKPCGLFFQVQGPRLLKTYSLWAGEENRILFYDSTGQRVEQMQLSESPDPCELAA